MSSEMTPYDRVIQHIFDTHATTEARSWLADQSYGLRAIFEFGIDESQYIVETAYAKGADEVFVVGDEDTIAESGGIDMLLVRCPQDPILRAQLFEFEEAVARESGYEGSLDQGQEWILLRWT